MKLKPFIRWAGGKQKVIDELLFHCPKDKSISRYFEPFLGAGSLFLANGFENGIISDVNFQLINSYKQIKSNYEDVHSLLNQHSENFNKNNEYYYRLREVYNNEINNGTFEQAARFIFLIHSNFNGIYRVNKDGYYNVPIGRLDPYLPNYFQLKEISKKLQSTEIECSDFQSILTKVDKDDFVYLDPPYPPIKGSKTTNQYTKTSFVKKYNKTIYDYCENLNDKGCIIMLTYPDTPLIREKFKDWNISNFSVFRSVNCKKIRKKIPELIIKNY